MFVQYRVMSTWFVHACVQAYASKCMYSVYYVHMDKLPTCSWIASLQVFAALLFSTAAKKVGVGKTGNEAIIRAALIEGVAS